MATKIKQRALLWHLGISALVLAAIVQEPARAEDKKAMTLDMGTAAGLIRAQGHPCNKVHELSETGKGSWRVRCNSGSFQVRLSEGKDPSVTALQ